MKRVAMATIDGERVQYVLIGQRGDWNWRGPDGQQAGDAAGGATKDAALQNLAIILENDEPG